MDIRPERNFEIAMRFHTDVNNAAKEFFTDLNGFQIIKRQYFDKLPLQVNPLVGLLFRRLVGWFLGRLRAKVDVDSGTC